MVTMVKVPCKPCVNSKPSFVRKVPADYTIVLEIAMNHRQHHLADKDPPLALVVLIDVATKLLEVMRYGRVHRNKIPKVL